MKIYYLYNGEEHRRLNSEGLDYTPAFIPQLAKYMGIKVSPITACELDKVNPCDVLFVGAEKVSNLPDCYTVLLGTGYAPAKRVKKVFAQTLIGEQSQPLFVPVTKPTTQGEIIVYAVDEEGNRVPAVVKGEHSLEFCFDLAATVWFSEDGFVPEKLPGYFFIGRTPDVRPLEGLGQDAYNDALLAVLEKELRAAGVPSIYRLPPNEDGKAPDAVMHFSGDDDCTDREFNLSAAKAMNEIGLPYHINAMPNNARDAFIYSKEDYEKTLSYGCEVALHTNFIGSSYTLETVKQQAELFTKFHGKHPRTNVNHCLIQGGSTAEWLRWLDACGIIADNGKCGHFNPANINAFDMYGHTFGSAFPMYTLDDAEHANAPIATMQIPLPYYEPRIYKETDSRDQVIKYVDDLVKYGRFGQFFIHPHYARTESPEHEGAFRAINTMLSRVADKGYSFTFSTTNNIAEFWLARATSNVSRDGDAIKVKADTPLLLRLPDDLKAPVVLVNGEKVRTQTKTVYGETACLVALPAGEQLIKRA